MSYSYVKNELEKRGARTSGTLERMTERLQRFLDVERQPVASTPPPPPSPSPILQGMQTPPHIARLRLDEDDDFKVARVARILCECARVPVEERLDRDECSLIEIRSRLDRLEMILDTLEHRMYCIECKTRIYDDEEQVSSIHMTQVPVIDNSIHRSNSDCPSTNYTENILGGGY